MWKVYSSSKKNNWKQSKNHKVLTLKLTQKASEEYSNFCKGSLCSYWVWETTIKTDIIRNDKNL